MRKWLRSREWRHLARENQLPPPGDWRTWLLLAGRGFGKTRTGAEWVHANVHRYGRWHLVGPTASAVRDVMVEGESGVMATATADNRPKYEPSKLRLTWPNGAVASLFSADEPDRLRGPQCEAAWADEIATWRYPDAWDMLQLGLRLGPDPRQIVTTTPRNVKVIRDLIADPNTTVVRGSTYENRANLADAFFSQIVSRYEGTRLGRQELYAELLTDTPGALWKASDIDHDHVPPRRHFEGAIQPDFRRVVVAVDPAVTSGESADETGIVVAGVASDGRGYVLADYSMRGTPDAWARAAVKAYHDHKADRIVAESNNGGEMVSLTIRTVDASVPVRLVQASRGKRTRAEPVAALYEQGKVTHLVPMPQLEDQMTGFTPDSSDSPDRMDALVWALTDLMLKSAWGSNLGSGVA